MNVLVRNQIHLVHLCTWLFFFLYPSERIGFILKHFMLFVLLAFTRNICSMGKYTKLGSHSIEPKRDWTHFLKIRFVVAGGGFYSYHKLQCIKLDKEKKNQFYAYKKHLTQFLKMGSVPFWVQFHATHI